MSEEPRFRTAVFGGFAKADVAAYLERSAQEHTEKLSALRRELSQAETARNESEEARTAQEKRIADLESEKQRLETDLLNREAALKELDGEKAELEKLLAELRGRVDRLAPAAAAYETVKDRTAGIELEAHGRAQQIEAESREKIKKIREETAEWFARMKGTYDRLHADVDGIMLRAARELEAAKASLDGLGGAFEGYHQDLRALGELVETIDGPKLPDPLPVSGKR